MPAGNDRLPRIAAWKVRLRGGLSVLSPALAATAGSGVAAKTLRAEETVGWTLDYHGPEPCSSPLEFSDAVRARIRLAARSVTPQLRVRVHLAKADNRVMGRAEVSEGDERIVDRAVDGATCQEVGEALALIVALAFDRSLAPPEARPDGGRGEEPVDGGEEPVDGGEEPVDGGEEPVDGGSEASFRSLRRAELPPEEGTLGGWSVGAQGRAQGGLAPWVTYGGSVFAERIWRARGFRFSVSYARQSGSLRDTPGTASFSLLLARLDSCPFRWQLATGLDVSPCVTLGLGRVEAAGTPADAVNAHETRSYGLWFDIGVVARTSLRIHGPFWAEMHGELLLPFFPGAYEFVVDGQPKVAYTVARVTGGGGLGLAYRFP